MRLKTPSLRRRLTRTLTFLGVVTACAAVALVWLTTLLGDVIDAMGRSVDRVYLAEEAELALLLHARSRDPLVRASLEADLERQLEGARLHVTTAGEAELLDATRRAVDLYLSQSRATQHPLEENVDLLPAAFSALDRLASASLARAHEAERQAKSVQRAATLVAATAAAAILAVVGFVVWWLRVRAFQPFLSLGEAMARFAHGDLDVRALESGDAEPRAMARSFNDLASTLARQRRAQLTFLAGVAHDLRNPLNALSLASGFIRPEDPLPPEPALRQLLARVKRQVKKLDRMVSDLMDSARIEAGQLDLQVETCDARVVARHVVELYGETSQRHRIELTVPEQPAWMVCDPLRIEQVLSNLVSNAIKYSPEGGMVAVEVRLGRGVVELSVRDEGLGMTSEEVESLFEPFRRTSQLRHDIPGVGLGLFVVKKIVDAHAGRLAVSSQPGVGTTFEIILPAAEDAPHCGS